MTPLRRDRLGWWIYVVVLAAAALFIAHSFVGLLVLGVFGYYATRPISNRVDDYVDSESIAAAVTVLIVLVPVFLLVVYAGFHVFQQLQQVANESVVSMLLSRVLGIESMPTGEGGTSFGALLQDPPSLRQLSDLSFWSELQQGVQAFNAVFGGIVLMSLAVTLAYALLEYDEKLSDGFVELVGGRETTAYTYAAAVDDDLESVFFGNLLFVVVMSVIATATYAATNLVAPSGVHVPMVITLGFLTGLASLIPIVVGKVVYLPVVAYLAFQATRADGSALAFVGGVLVVYFLVLDILPQSVIQPYVSGRQLDMLLLLFAYILGPVLFGWYGFFLLPIVFVLMLETVRIVLPELLHGEPIAPDADLAEDTGADTEEIRDDVTDADERPRGADGTDPAQS